MPGHSHNASAGTQNQGNSLGDRSCVRQSKLYRMYESGNGVKGVLGQGNLCWDQNQKEGAYSGHQVYDHERDNLPDYNQQTRQRGQDMKNLVNASYDNYNPQPAQRSLGGNSNLRLPYASESQYVAPNPYQQPPQQQQNQQYEAYNSSRAPQPKTLRDAYSRTANGGGGMADVMGGAGYGERPGPNIASSSAYGSKQQSAPYSGGGSSTYGSYAPSGGGGGGYGSSAYDSNPTYGDHYAQAAAPRAAYGAADYGNDENSAQNYGRRAQKYEKDGGYSASGDYRAGGVGPDDFGSRSSASDNHRRHGSFEAGPSSQEVRTTRPW